MTVSSELSRKTYAGDGVTTSHATSPMVFFDATDLTVYVVTTATGAVVATLTLDTHYSVSGGDGSTGTVNLAGGSSPYGAVASGRTLVVVRDLPATQAVDFVNNEATDAEVAEDALDKLTMLVQQAQTLLDRSVKLADSDVTGASTTLPTPAATKLLGWDGTGLALTNYAFGSITASVIPTAFMETLLDDATAQAARQTLLLDKHGADVASAATINLDTTTGDLVDVTGTTTITAITLAEGVEKTVRFTGALTLTHGASLVLPGAANITTVAGDYAVFRGYASGVVRCVNYQKVTYAPSIGKQPTRQIFTSGSGTYTTPTGATRILVRLIGGGGGGAGSGTTAANGNAGSNTTFGSSFLQANGGAAGHAGDGVRGVGGSAAGGDLNIAGGEGDATDSSTLQNGGRGGDSLLGCGGPRTYPGNVAGNAGTGYGAGGGGAGAGATGGAGGGGGAGGYCEKLVTAPSATYAYAVGAQNGGGGAGTGGSAGAVGTAGVIIVDEYYD